MKRGESRRLRTGSPAHILTAQWAGFLLLPDPEIFRVLTGACAPIAEFARSCRLSKLILASLSFVHPVLFQLGPLLVPSYGACAALGVLLALGLAQITASRAGLNPRHAWNLLLLAVFASMAVSRLVLIVLNLSDLRRHPRWLMAVSMVHHPLLAAVGIVSGTAAVLGYTRWMKLPVASVADCLAAPISIGMAAEQLGALLAGSDFGRDSASNSWFGSVTYSSELAGRWSGTPLGVPLYPVQAYAAAGALLLAAIVFALLSWPHRNGDVAGIWLAGAGALVFLTEIFRDWEGRGVLFSGLADIPQLVGLGMVLLGGAVLLDWRPSAAAGKVHDV
jgi:phosphatidylglycerol:prolipoprotein diacylglycerol transferase